MDDGGEVGEGGEGGVGGGEGRCLGGLGVKGDGGGMMMIKEKWGWKG